MRALLLLLALAACGDAATAPPTMAPVDMPRAPRGIALQCAVEFEPIVLPTTTAEQVEGRQRDREAARQAIETCDGRRSRAVRHIRRLGATE
ncbi:hypothetical protein E9232_004905 [Inquilinus ginsengisoli]|uniref:UrcA family protein n=1 Tax=Inquilinus ginsengisoli TaxID=363840 RepID=A0ABU1JXT6_9PROT|nr:hypothetical protein [Inquilinus ginsengisoli]MDR6292365.1 hypothetical protein [Inquilinus ginsengisoli]